MATKKQIILPIIVLAIGIAGLVGISALKKPPEEKPVVDTTPLVSVEAIEYKPMTFSVSSYGVVAAKYDTELVAQVSGEIIYLADKFVKGGFVKKGDILAKIDPSDYEAGLLDSQANVASAKANMVQERANGEVALREWAEITNSKPTALSLRKPQLAQELAKLKSAEADLLRSHRDLERTVIRAPYDALISSREIGLGAYVTTGSKIGHIYNTDTAEIRLPLADKEMQYLDQKGTHSEVTLMGNFAGSKQQWQGKIVRSEGVVDSKSRMTYLVAEIEDPYGLKTDKNELRFGTYVTANIQGSNAGNVAVIPRHLIVNGLVAIMDSDNTLRYKPVKIIRQEGANVVISEGLDPGMEVITSALDYPLEGMKLALPVDKILQDEPIETDKTEIAMEGK
ncbi:efflux RND transporter periplasmic adaptor subunit [Shewanella sp. SR43-4]|uniref:Efflux RND transporter periplasmic adaptor subunit n=1 Tax=Shewanella vesiculosa TaxID=518738 RepID=A0ABV0FQ77_9GAMM|nr:MULTISPECIES: efflux RND transporter periplasmic adaptor subunit [Shewanella]NCQ43875.1 efflux RND transporter periplasmic adaptor subunit [Shewanella frigidimarina]MBB1317302.1 efflux RND transporter periplasmic adaptor subunit [Shewanella sp. SR43-4]MBB1323671.1 efflux RND transporter periplasmic adaptor subunit [Shewanella sp. SR43-8]MBB1389434.1 efflux RND transporter periplasmic adaptor subunit [Shewanella sp. SG44-6]MBB1476458.1 efflux RND transporter periplasmic adaptor subunit [Shew